MDPYLEKSWRTVHQNLITYAQAQLNEVLPESLIARSEDRIVVDDVSGARTRVRFPDVRIYEEPGANAGGETASVAIAEPIVLELDVEPHTESFITILDPEGSLVTAIEFLSPRNKVTSGGRDEFREKRDELVAASVNFVEIDLVRAGDWRRLLSPHVAPPQADTLYRVVVRRMHPIRRVELFPLAFREPLPRIPIPLRYSDGDVPLDLPSLLGQVYRAGRYDRLRYDEPLDPPLDPEDEAWADALLRAAGRRT